MTVTNDPKRKQEKTKRCSSVGGVADSSMTARMTTKLR